MGNTMWLTASSLATKGLAYVQFLLVVRAFAENEVGMYAVALTGVLFAELLANLGLDRVVVREVARGGRSARDLFENSLVLKTAASLAAYFLCLGVFWLLFPEIVRPHGSALAAFFAYVPACALARSFESHFTALERMVVPAIGQFVERLVMLAAAMAAFWGVLDFGQFLAVFPLAGLVRAAIPAALFWATRRGGGPVTLSAHQGRSLLADSSWMFGVEIVAVAYFRIDIFMLSKMVDLRGTGLYQAAYKVFDCFIALFAGYLTAIFPAMARDGARLRPSMLVLGSGAVFLCFSLPGILFRHEILSLFKPEYVEAAPVLACLMLTLPLVYANSLLANFAVAASRVRALFIVAVPMLAVNVCLNLAFIPAYGIFGSSLATLSSEVLLGVALWLVLKPCTGSSTHLPKSLRGTS